MTRTARDLEAYLGRLQREWEVVDDGTYAVSTGPTQPPVAVHVSETSVLFRLLIGQVPADPASQVGLFRKLLELNAAELLYCAYGLDADRIVLMAGHEIESLDLNEVEAVLADMDLALARHVPKLRELCSK